MHKATKAKEENYGRIIALYMGGKGVNQIERENGVSRVTVWRALRWAGIETPHGRSRTKLNMNAIAKLHGDGKTPAEIGKLLGKSVWLIRRRLKEIGAYDPQIGVDKAKKSLVEFNRVFTDAAEADICNRYARGESQYSLSKLYDAPRSTIESLLHRHGFRLEREAWIGGSAHKKMAKNSNLREQSA